MAKDSEAKRPKKLSQKVFDVLNEHELSYLAVSLGLTTWHNLYAGSGKKDLKKLLSTEAAATALSSFDIPTDAKNRMSDVGINYVDGLIQALRTGEPLPEWDAVVEKTKARLEAGEDGVMAGTAGSRLRSAKAGPRRAAKRAAPKVEEPEEVEVDEDAGEEEEEAAPAPKARTRASAAAPRRRARAVKKSEPEPEPEPEDEGEDEDDGESESAAGDLSGLQHQVDEAVKELDAQSKTLTAIQASVADLSEAVTGISDLLLAHFGQVNDGDEPASAPDINFHAYRATQLAAKALAGVAGMLGIEFEGEITDDALDDLSIEDLSTRGAEYFEMLFPAEE